MAYQPDDHDPGKARELDYLVKALGIDELYKRVNELDDKGDLPQAAEWNPTNNPMVQRTFHGEVGTLSSGPNEENVGRLDVVDPNHLLKIKALAEEQEAQAKEREERAEAERAYQDEVSKNSDAEKSKAEEKKTETKNEPPNKTDSNQGKVSTPASRSSTAAKK